MAEKIETEFYDAPSREGYFGEFGGRFVAETLMPLIVEVENEYNKIKNDHSFNNEFEYYLIKFV